MAFRSNDDFAVTRVRVEALGEPGQRRFRMLVLAGGRTTIVWMEKQQLQALGLALEQLLSQLPEGDGESAAIAPGGDFDLDTRRQFRVGRMELGYDETSERIVIVAHDISDAGEEEEESERQAAFVCGVTREQSREISADAAAVVAAGRPRCTMCGAPMGPGPHVCPQQNGHFPHQLEETEDDEEEE
ncbi:MAG TPA: DUF3090 family protein [Thermomicrobiales bacterium]|nr:DUF3090 family protein [Thermomicrobiales bacterium]